MGEEKQMGSNHPKGRGKHSEAGEFRRKSAEKTSEKGPGHVVQMWMGVVCIVQGIL